MTGIYRFWYRNFIIWRKYLLVNSLWNLAEPVMFIGAIGYGLGMYVGEIDGVPYLWFFAPAMIATTVMNTANFTTTYEAFVNFKIMKIYDAVIQTPLSITELILAEIIWATSKAFFSGICVIIGLAAFGLFNNYLMLPLILATILVTAYLFAALGMLVSSIARDFDDFTYYFTIFISPMFLFSGTFFPLDQLPAWARGVAWFLPLTHAVRIIRELYFFRMHVSMLGNLCWLFVVSLLITVAAVKLMKRRVIK